MQHRVVISLRRCAPGSAKSILIKAVATMELSIQRLGRNLLTFARPCNGTPVTAALPAKRICDGPSERNGWNVKTPGWRLG